MVTSPEKRRGEKVFGTYIDAVSWETAIERILAWGARRESRYVCLCNVHSVVSADQDLEFQEVINNADMAIPDGMPAAWFLRMLGFADQKRINGPDLMRMCCERAVQSGQGVFFYGSTNETLKGVSGIAPSFVRSLLI